MYNMVCVNQPQVLVMILNWGMPLHFLLSSRAPSKNPLTFEICHYSSSILHPGLGSNHIGALNMVNLIPTPRHF